MENNTSLNNNSEIENDINLDKLNIGLIVMNVLVFALTFMTGDTKDPEYMISRGAMYLPRVTEHGEWYRLISACFLHFDPEHLLNNMVMLGAVGSYVRRHMNGVCYIMLYLLSGIAGNILSFSLGNDAVSAGASGCVFGLTGALLGIALKNRGRVDDLRISRIILMIALSLYAGFSTSGVDNAAHAGGLACGFLISLIFSRKKVYQYAVMEDDDNYYTDQKIHKNNNILD